MRPKFLFSSFTALTLCLSLFTLVVYGHSIEDSSTDHHSGATQEAILTIDQISSEATEKPALSKWLHMLDKHESAEIENSSVMAFAPQVPGDLTRVLISVGGDEGVKGIFKAFFLSIFSIGVGFLVVLGAKRIAKKGITQLEQITPPGDDFIARFWAGLVKCIPTLTAVVLLALSSTLVFLFLAGSVTIEGRMLFQLLLGIVLIIRLCSILTHIIFAPGDASLRPFTLDDSVAKALHNALFISIAISLSGKLFIDFFKDLGALEQSVSWVAIVIGTILIAVFCYLVLGLRTPISNFLQLRVEKGDSKRIKGQLAAYWHIPALLYLFVAWFIGVGREIAGVIERDGSFLISLFIVPIFIVLSFLGRMVIRSTVDSLGLGKKIDQDSISTEDEAAVAHELIARKKIIESKSYLVFRIILAVVLTVWTLSLWGFDIPFAANAVIAILKSLVTLALAVICWRSASSFIERKIEEATPETTESAEDGDNEFGGAAPADRSQTLLPMLRKVLGSILVVMAILIILSSLGVNIAPVLAGAGVLGLAVGFGAQKLVSDVLSGFFFLLDDAFRVGEYIQTGSIRGTVEAITLRNVMLRHHMGMLQIVPHSDLGAVTNFMRGGIVIKFPLEFPYDTDIDKVRKIIKKVGQAMLEDEEIGDDFILPLKSQGVNEIANSVMVIRVKFTAKPGKQFVIKREAFRRITEALNSKNIYYAHRKVLVDFPDESHKSDVDEETRKKAIIAGSAATIAADADQQKGA